MSLPYRVQDSFGISSNRSIEIEIRVEYLWFVLSVLIGL